MQIATYRNEAPVAETERENRRLRRREPRDAAPAAGPAAAADPLLRRRA